MARFQVISSGFTTCTPSTAAIWHMPSLGGNNSTSSSSSWPGRLHKILAENIKTFETPKPSQKQFVAGLTGIWDDHISQVPGRYVYWMVTSWRLFRWWCVSNLQVFTLFSTNYGLGLLSCKWQDIYIYKYSTGPLQVKQETRHWPQSTVGTKSELDTFPPPEKKKQSHVTDKSPPPPPQKNNKTILPVKFAPVMSEVRYVEHVTHCTTIIYGTKTGPSHPIDFLRQWR